MAFRTCETCYTDNTETPSLKGHFMQSKSPQLEDLANLMTNAFGAVKGVGDEARAVARARADAFIADMDLVSRDEFEAMKLVLQEAQTEIGILKAQIVKLQARKPKIPRKSRR